MTDLPSVADYFKSLNDSAEVRIDISKPFKWYLRSTELVFKQAAVYLTESDHEKCYVLMMKFSHLLIKELPRHPEYNKYEYGEQKTKLKKLCLKAIETLEKLKPTLEATYLAFVEERKQFALAQEESEKTRIAEQAKLEKFKKELDKFEASTSVTATSSEIAPLKESTSIESVSLPPIVNTAPVPPLVSSHPIIPSVHQYSLPEPIPSPSHQQQPQTPAKKPKYFSENGRPLRPVHIPSSIIDKFLSIAASNTNRNVETCGVIAGTSDTCAMTNEEEIIDAQDSRDVMCLGWIHTHPTQSCFLSSVDVHTHMPFQMLMEEAIAIVCAPSKSPNFGIFRLTDPPGLEFLAKCPHSGSTFHQHPENIQIYRELKGNDVHAKLDSGLALEIIDLRSK